MGVFWGRRQLGSPILVEADYHLKVFESTLIWTGCSPDGEIPLYLRMGLNYLSCDRLLMGMEASLEQDEQSGSEWRRCTTVT